MFRDVGSVLGEGWLEADHVEDAFGARIRQLEMELRAARETQQVSSAELESANEELRSANEEMSSLNEELQLSNAELAVRVDELGAALSDIQNLLESTRTAAIILDRDLRVRLFTEAAKDFCNFSSGDLGLPISDLRLLTEKSSIECDAANVMRTLEAVERQVYRLDAETPYRMRIIPYRTADDVVGGVMVTFTA
jgi:two-component system, chemotaxis family, CheB/CheR fusion protein